MMSHVNTTVATSSLTRHKVDKLNNIKVSATYPPPQHLPSCRALESLPSPPSKAAAPTSSAHTTSSTQAIRSQPKSHKHRSARRPRPSCQILGCHADMQAKVAQIRHASKSSPELHLPELIDHTILIAPGCHSHSVEPQPHLIGSQPPNNQGPDTPNMQEHPCGRRQDIQRIRLRDNPTWQIQGRPLSMERRSRRRPL
jgi:hypothetical protein